MQSTPTPPQQDQPSGPSATFGSTITILFSDIRGFTEYTDAHGDEAAYRMLQHHNGLVQEQIALYGGHVVKTLGDSFMVSFESARMAVTCAIAVQRAIQRHNQSQPGATIEIGVGINSGEPVRDSGDLFGGSVNLASRICGAAGPGEILVSDTVRSLVGRMEGCEYLDRGYFTLKGIGEPQRLLEIDWSGVQPGKTILDDRRTGANTSGAAVPARTKSVSGVPARLPWAVAGGAVLLLVLGGGFFALREAGGFGQDESTDVVHPQLPEDPLPRRGKVLFDLNLDAPFDQVSQGFGNSQTDSVYQVWTKGNGNEVEFGVGPNSFAALGVRGLALRDFVAEVRTHPIDGDGYYALQFHVGPSGYQAVRVVPGTGSLVVTEAPFGPHRVEDEKPLSGPLLKVPATSNRDVTTLAVSVRGSEIVVYRNGTEVARATSSSANEGPIEFSVGSFTAPFRLHLLRLRVHELPPD